MRYIAAKVAYTGEGFNGSQRQPYLRTVEGEIIYDLCTVLHVDPIDIDLHMAGRTDKGVNALGNVAVFNTDFEDVPTLMKALNANSERIFYRSYTIVDETFNPRFADWRVYAYTIPKKRMDLERMKECAQLFVGEHDFIRFCRPDGKPTTAKIDSIDVIEKEQTIVLRFTARFYLWNMVRRISAAIITLGRGKAELNDVISALEGKEINFGLARADALTLEDTIYVELAFTSVDPRTYSYRTDEETFCIGLRDGFYKALEEDDERS